MATGNVTTTTAAVFLPTIWSVDTVRATEAALVFAGLVKRYDALVKSRGQTIEIPNISNLSATAKTINTDVSNTTITETATTLNIDKWYYSAFKIEDMVAVQSNYDLRSEYSEKAGYGIAAQVDSDVAGTYSSWTTTAVGTYGTDIGDATIISADLALNLQNMPRDNRAFVIHPNQLAAIMKIDKFVKADYLGEYQNPTPVKKGPQSRWMWGNIYGIPVYYSTNVLSTAATPTQYHNVLFHKEAMALALQQAPRLQAAYWLPSLAWQVIVDTIYGVTALRLTGGVECRS
ncbi:MAG TPA: hypothetical protein VLH94_01395 [Spirochaetia bacterium]|nr:hypothetical protein [Spirochaetia bacterium]